MMLETIKSRGYNLKIALGNMFYAKIELLDNKGDSIDLTTDLNTITSVGRAKRSIQHTNSHFETKDIDVSLIVENNKTYAILRINDTSNIRSYGRLVYQIDLINNNINKNVFYGQLEIIGGLI